MSWGLESVLTASSTIFNNTVHRLSMLDIVPTIPIMEPTLGPDYSHVGCFGLPSLPHNSQLTTCLISDRGAHWVWANHVNKLFKYRAAGLVIQWIHFVLQPVARRTIWNLTFPDALAEISLPRCLCCHPPKLKRKRLFSCFNEKKISFCLWPNAWENAHGLCFRLPGALWLFTTFCMKSLKILV